MRETQGVAPSVSQGDVGAHGVVKCRSTIATTRTAGTIRIERTGSPYASSMLIWVEIC